MQGSGLGQTLKYMAVEQVKRSPRLWHYAWRAAKRLPFLLPHEKDYYGFRHFAGDRGRGEGLALDIGANNGITALGLRAVGLPHHILSIEANPSHEPELARTAARMEHFSYRIVGAGDAHGTLTLHTPVYKGIPIHTMSSVELDYAKNTVARDFPRRVVDKVVWREDVVDLLPLDDLDLAPDLVKVDVEGFDLHVLRGMRRTIATHKPVLMVEYTPGKLKDIQAMLAEFGYRAFMYHQDEDTFEPAVDADLADVWRAQGLQINLFFVPDGREQGLPLR
jgi:FkbM family methyltransferase